MRPKQPLRVLVYPWRGRHVTTYRCEVKGPGVRTTVGTFGTRAAAQAAGERYMATGERPPAAKRGPKGRRQHLPALPRRRKTLSGDAESRVLLASRVTLTSAAHARDSGFSAEARSCSRPAGCPSPSREDAAQNFDRAARLETLRRLWRAGA